MTIKRANGLFFTLIMTHIIVSLLLSIFGEYLHIGIIASLFLGEAILIVPALLFLWLSPSKPVPNGYADARQPAPNGFTDARQSMPNGSAGTRQPARMGMFRRIKVSTLLMIALCTFLIMPLVTVLNTLSLFFTDNEIVAIEGDILSVPFPVMLFMIGIFGPFCEEFVFRGIIYGSYAGHAGRMQPGTGTAAYPSARRGGGLWPIMLSSLLFGLMHMNFNQAIYAFALGILLAFLVEAAGSLWASVFCHMFFNSFEVVLMYLSEAILGSEYIENMSKASAELTGTQLQAGLAVYLIIAAVTTPIAACVIVWIAKNEGRQETVQALLCRRSGSAAGQGPQHSQMPVSEQPVLQPREPLLSVPLIVAVVICLGFMSIEWFLL